MFSVRPRTDGASGNGTGPRMTSTTATAEPSRAEPDPEARPPRNPAFRRLAAVLDFHHFETLASLRLRLSLRAFKVLAVSLSLAGLVALLVASTGVFALTRALLADQPGSVHGLTVMFCVGNLYAAAGYLLREAMSQRRFAVANSPNTGLFRALDIPAREVLIVYCWLRATVYYLALLVVTAVFTFVFDASPAVLLTPVSMHVATLAIATRSALRRTRPRPVPASGWAALGAVSFALGYCTARYVLGPIRESGLASSFGPAEAERLVVGIGAASALTAVCLAVRLGFDLRRLGADSFTVQLAAPRSAASRRGRLLTGTHPIAGILDRELAASAIHPLIRKIFGFLLMALLACLGVLASGTGLLPVGGFGGRASTIAYALVLATSLGMTELILRAAGPATFAAQFRFAWEAGLRPWGIASAAATCYLLPVAALGAGSALLLLQLAGPAIALAGPVGAAVAAGAASLLAEWAIAPPRNPDGSAAPNTVGALAALILSAPVLFLLALASPVGGLAAAGYGICLIGGAIACIRHRILTLPSTSST